MLYLDSFTKKILNPLDNKVANATKNDVFESEHAAKEVDVLSFNISII